MKRIFTLTLGLTLLIPGLKAQDIHFSQFWATPLNLSPAETGNFDGTYRAAVIYRNQWNQFSPYHTISGSYDMNFDFGLMPGDAVSAGFTLFNDRAGSFTIDGLPLATNSVMLSGAYHKAIGIDHRVTLGVQMGYYQKSIDLHQLTYGSQWRERGGFIGELPPDIAGNVNGNGVNDLNVNVGLQVSSIITPELVVTGGFSGFNLNRPNENFIAGPEFNLGARFNTYAGATYLINDQLAVTPKFIYMRQSAANELVLGSEVAYRIGEAPDPEAFDQTTTGFNAVLFGGLWYRNNIGNTDAIFPTAGIEYNDFRFGISYDVTLSRLRVERPTAGSFEVSMIYIGRVTQAPSRIIVPCIRF